MRILKRNYSKANEESVNVTISTDWNFANCIGISYESGATLIFRNSTNSRLHG